MKPTESHMAITHYAPVNKGYPPHSTKAQGLQAINSNPHVNRAFTLNEAENRNGKGKYIGNPFKSVFFPIPAYRMGRKSQRGEVWTFVNILIAFTHKPEHSTWQNSHDSDGDDSGDDIDENENGYVDDNNDNDEKVMMMTTTTLVDTHLTTPRRFRPSAVPCCSRMARCPRSLSVSYPTLSHLQTTT